MSDSPTPQDQKAIAFNNKHAWDLLPALRSAFNLPQPPKGALDSYDPEVLKALTAFQSENSLGADGLIGRGTRPTIEKAFTALLHNDARPLWPHKTAPPKKRHAHYVKLCAILGYTLEEKPLLLGLRGVTLLAPRTHQTRSGASEYDDTFVLLLSDGRLREFRGSTHPFTRTATKGTIPDFDGDGEPDVGMIRPGLYNAERGQFQEQNALRLSVDGSRRIPAYRDTNHDGFFSTQEKTQSEEATETNIHRQTHESIGAYATNILFHKGGGFGSVGCQTTTQKNVELLFKHAPLDYLLFEATKAIAILKTPPDDGSIFGEGADLA